MKLEVDENVSRSQATGNEQIVESNNSGNSLGACSNEAFASISCNLVSSSFNASNNQNLVPVSCRIPAENVEEQQLLVNKANQTVSTAIEKTVDSTKSATLISAKDALNFAQTQQGPDTSGSIVILTWPASSLSHVKAAASTKSTCTATKVNPEQSTSSLSISAQPSSSKDSTLVGITHAQKASPETSSKEAKKRKK